MLPLLDASSAAFAGTLAAVAVSVPPESDKPDPATTAVAVPPLFDPSRLALAGSVAAATLSVPLVIETPAPRTTAVNVLPLLDASSAAFAGTLAAVAVIVRPGWPSLKLAGPVQNGPRN